MPIDKLATLRYRIINSCFNNRQKPEWTIDEFLAKFRDHDIIIKRRTLERDFEAMRYGPLNYNAPIAYNRSTKSFYYTDKNYTINKLPITPGDLRPFITAAHVMQQFKGMTFLKEYEGAVDKLGKIVNQLDAPATKDIMAFEECAYYKGHDYVEPIVNAITDNLKLRIAYEKFRDKSKDHIFHPYFLIESEGRWYIFGYSEARHYTITLGLDRIVEMETLPTVFTVNKTVKQKQINKFKHTLGVTIGKGPVEVIELQFSPKFAPYITTKHFHHTQRTVREDENGLIISLKLIINRDLLREILRYGAEVKVLNPPALKEQVKAIIEEMRRLYE